ncbi:MAG TPA: LecA/PA-IL family lectin [Smithellaceae bacterium]|nr:LecA/PA-IL family lectin [Smithellaceae bacterium]
MKIFLRVFSWLLLINILGCAGIQYSDKIQSVEITQFDSQETTARVLAQAEEWRNSGVIVEKGKKYAIKAKGQWSYSPLCSSTGPDGFTSCPSIGTIVKGWSGATLIGKINETGTPFAIGNELVLTSQDNGTLYLRINDPPGLCGDNDGYVDVNIALADTNKDRLAKSEIRPQAFETEQKYASPKKEKKEYVQGQKWAVIIGISKYKDSRIAGLRYASADARSFYEWLVSQRGGGYAPSRIKLLLDSEATVQNIKNALFNWLKQPLAEDMITIYFAGHGSPDSPDSPNNLFLLPFDSVYDNVAATGFPMWDIETALKRFIKAKKVVVIADACHSGGVGQSFDIARRDDRGIRINPINSGLQNLSQIGDGIAVISASDDKQFSQEGQQWGNGHGVFTYYLLKGIKGEADYNRDGHVTLGELIPYLSEKVRRETRNAQSPTVSGKFDPALSIAQ